MPARPLILLTTLTFIALVLPAPLLAQATDCSCYDSQIWAQSVFDSDPVQYAAVDPDGNGLSCVELHPGDAPALWSDEILAGAEPTQLARVVDGDTIRVTQGGVEEPAPHSD